MGRSFDASLAHFLSFILYLLAVVGIAVIRGEWLRQPWLGVERGWRDVDADPLKHLVSLPPSDLGTHLHVVGATGSGKTTALLHLIAQAIFFGISLVVLDLRGTLVDDILDLLAGNVHPANVLLIDLRDKKHPTGFDVFRGEGEPYFRALGLQEAVRAEMGDLGVQLSETMRYAFLLLAQTGHPLTAIESLFYNPEFLSRLLEARIDLPVRAFFERYLAQSTERRATLAMPVLNKVSMLLSTASLRKVLGCPRPVDLASFLNRPATAILVSLAVDELHGAGRMFGNTFLSCLCREIFARVGTSEKRRNPVQLFVDEFENFGCEDFESILAEGRKFKFTAILAHQTLAQLTPRFRSIVLNNVGAKLYMKTGRDDSAILSRDLTGDPKAIDFGAFRTGEAALWTRNGGIRYLEVNSPINRGQGERTPLARALVAEIQRRHGWRASDVDSHSNQDTAIQGDIGKKVSQPKPRTSLEDWLC